MDKYEYMEGFCAKLRYKGQWPCLFTETGGHFEKAKMICSTADPSCMESCTVFENIPLVYSEEKEWLLKDIEKRAR